MPPAPLLWLTGAHRHRDPVGAHARGDEDLLAVDHPVGAVPPRRGAQAGHVGAGARLGDGQRRDLLAAQHRRAPPRCCDIRRAVAQHRRQADVQREQAGHQAAAAAVARHGGREHVAQRERRRRAAQRLGIPQSQQAQCRRLAVQRAREFPRLVPRVHLRRDALQREALDGLRQRGHVLAQFRIHVAASKVTSTCEVAACWPGGHVHGLDDAVARGAQRMLQLHRFQHQQGLAARHRRAGPGLHGDHLAVEGRAQFLGGGGGARAAAGLERSIVQHQVHGPGLHMPAAVVELRTNDRGRRDQPWLAVLLHLQHAAGCSRTCNADTWPRWRSRSGRAKAQASSPARLGRRRHRAPPARSRSPAPAPPVPSGRATRRRAAPGTGSAPAPALNCGWRRHAASMRRLVGRPSSCSGPAPRRAGRSPPRVSPRARSACRAANRSKGATARPSKIAWSKRTPSPLPSPGRG